MDRSYSTRSLICQIFPVLSQLDTSSKRKGYLCFGPPPLAPFQSGTPVIQASPEVAIAEDNLELLVLQSPTQVPRLLL